MTNTVLGVLVLLAATSAACAVDAERTEPSTRPSKLAEKQKGYADVNGLKMYYEISGEGAPAVYIHPVLSHSGLVPHLTSNRRWIAVDLQGHGRTADIDRPMTCEQHSADIAGLLKQLKIEQADFFGDSFGGTIALMMAVRHPELVRRVVSHGGSLTAYPGTAAERPSSEADFVKWQREEYQKVAPDAKHWATLYNKATDSLYAWKGFSAAQLKAINIPVLIVCGDHDLIPVERCAEWSRMVPNAQLAVIPDASHFVLFSEPEKLLPTIAGFLDAPTSKLPLGMANGYYPGATR